MNFPQLDELSLQQFQQKGFVMLSCLISEDEADKLLSLIKSSKKTLSKSSLNRRRLHFYSNIFKRDIRIQQIISSQKIIDAVVAIGGPDLWIRWDQAVMKEPGGEEFPWHQDNGYNHLRVEHYQLWFALTDMDADNGGLWLLPGSHLEGFKKHHNVMHHQITKAEDTSAIKIKAKKGDAVLFSSLLLHKTSPNITNRKRWAYVVEYMSQEHYDPYVDPPYFLVSENGISKPHWVHSYRGDRSWLKRFKYLDLYLKDNISSGIEGLKSFARKIFKG